MSVPSVSGRPAGFPIAAIEEETDDPHSADPTEPGVEAEPGVGVEGTVVAVTRATGGLASVVPVAADWPTPEFSSSSQSTKTGRSSVADAVIS